MMGNIEHKLGNNNIVTALSAERSIVFIDSKVDDYQILARGVIPGTEVFILDADRDGIAQISQVLNQKPRLSTVHLVSHGSPGCLYLGNTQLSLDTLDKYQEELKTWFFSSSSVPPSPSTLLIYGCNVAAGDAGEEFIAKLHNITGAEISASSTPIGNKAQGGNWELDIATRQIDNKVAFTEATQEIYSGLFVTVTYNDDPNPDTTIPEPNDNPSEII